MPRVGFVRDQSVPFEKVHDAPEGLSGDPPVARDLSDRRGLVLDRIIE
jgi:hypothetical protein